MKIIVLQINIMLLKKKLKYNNKIQKTKRTMKSYTILMKLNQFKDFQAK